MEREAESPRQLILVVDDDPLVRKAMVRELGREFRVLTAESRSEAQKILDENGNIRVVVSDCQMEMGYSGVEFLEAVNRERPQIGRILVSGSLSITEAKQIIKKQIAHTYFQKPWNQAELLNAVRRHCRQAPGADTR